jgi:hypothetical protein
MRISYILFYDVKDEVQISHQFYKNKNTRQPTQHFYVILIQVILIQGLFRISYV